MNPRRFPDEGSYHNQRFAGADFRALHLDSSNLFLELLNLVEVHAAIDLTVLGVHQLDLLHVFRNGHDTASQHAHGGQFGGTRINLCIDAE